DDDAAARIGALAQADRQHAARDAEIFHGARQGEGIGRDDAHFALEIDEGFFVEGLGIYDGRIDVGEDLELVRAAHVVTIAAGAVADDAPPIDRAHLPRLERGDHARTRRLPDPAIILDAHGHLCIRVAVFYAFYPWKVPRPQSIENQRW